MTIDPLSQQLVSDIAQTAVSITGQGCTFLCSNSCVRIILTTKGLQPVPKGCSAVALQTRSAHQILVADLDISVLEQEP